MRKLAAAGMICLIAFLLIGAADWNTTLLNISRARLEKAMREVGGCMRQTEDGPLKNQLGFIEDKLWLQFRAIQEMQKRLPELRKSPVSPESRREWNKFAWNSTFFWIQSSSWNARLIDSVLKYGQKSPRRKRKQ